MGNAKSRFKELRAYMKRTGITQATLARVAGVSEPTFSKVMKGPRSFTADAAGRLAHLTGIPVEKLLTDPNVLQIVKLLGKRMNSGEGNTRDKSNVA